MVTLCSCTIQFTESIASDDYESQADRNYHRQNPGGIVKAVAELLRYAFIQCVLLLLWMFIVGVRLFFSPEPTSSLCSRCPTFGSASMLFSPLSSSASSSVFSQVGKRDCVTS